jgi:hypothetical protein
MRKQKIILNADEWVWSDGTKVLCMPDGKSVTTLFRRFKTSTRGGNGFTSLNDKVISVPACGLATVAAGLVDVPDAFPVANVASLVASPFDLLFNSCAGSDTSLDRLESDAAHLRRLARTRWYVRLRSFRKVSRKQNTKSTRLTPMSAANNQNEARLRQQSAENRAE